MDLNKLAVSFFTLKLVALMGCTKVPGWHGLM